jgi:hypothetical protein
MTKGVLRSIIQSLWRLIGGTVCVVCEGHAQRWTARITKGDCAGQLSGWYRKPSEGLFNLSGRESVSTICPCSACEGSFMSCKRPRWFGWIIREARKT